MTKANSHPYLPTLLQQYRSQRIDRREFLRTATLLGVSAGAAYSLAAGIDGVSPPAHAQEAKPLGGTLRLETTVYDISDPAVANTTAHPWIYSQVVEYLTQIGTDNATRPHLLDSWERQKTSRLGVASPGRRQMAFRSRLRVGRCDLESQASLSDDTGSSVLGLMKGYLLNAIDTGEKNDRGRTIYRHELWADNAIEKLDDLTIRLNLKQPQLAVPEHLNHYQAVMLYPEEGGCSESGPRERAPSRWWRSNRGRRAAIEAVEGYWGEGPYLDRVEFVDVGGNSQAIANAVLSGQVHGAFQVLPEFSAMLAERENLQLYEVTTADTAVSRMNLTHKPFDDARVRKAFRLAIESGKGPRESPLARLPRPQNTTMSPKFIRNTPRCHPGKGTLKRRRPCSRRPGTQTDSRSN